MVVEPNDQTFAPQWLIFLIVGLTLFRLGAASQTGLLPDETYYWLWSRSPQAGYYDHPPMIAWWIWFSSEAFGQSAFAIRLVPVLSTAADAMMTYAVAREIGLDRHRSAMAGLFLNTMLMFGLNATVATPDSPAVMFWLLTLWMLARLRRTGDLSLWLAVGLFAGLGCVSKYTNFFLGPGICLCFALDREFRARCSVAWIAAGLLVAAVVFAPVFVWNMQNDWVSFEKQFGRIVEVKGSRGYVLEFLATQFALLNPFIASLALLGLATLSRSGREASLRPIVFLMTTSLPLAAYMLQHSLHDRVQGNWLLPIYPSLAVLAALQVKKTSRASMVLSSLAVFLGLGSVCAVNLYMASPIAGTLAVRSPADGAVGWDRLANSIQKIARHHEAGWIGTANYGVTAELTYNLPDWMRVVDIAEPIRYAFDGPVQPLGNRTGLLVLRERDFKPEALKACFGSVMPIDVIDRFAHLRQLELYHIVKVSNPASSLMSSGCAIDGGNNPISNSAKRRDVATSNRIEEHPFRVSYGGYLNDASPDRQ